MIYSHSAKALFSTVLHDCGRGEKNAWDDDYDHV